MQRVGRVAAKGGVRGWSGGSDTAGDCAHSQRPIKQDIDARTQDFDALDALLELYDVGALAGRVDTHVGVAGAASERLGRGAVIRGECMPGGGDDRRTIRCRRGLFIVAIGSQQIDRRVYGRAVEPTRLRLQRERFDPIRERGSCIRRL